MEVSPIVQPACGQCGKICKGRSDKKFCSESCRNEFHNRNKLREYKEIKSIFIVIRKNRRILKKSFDRSREKPVVKNNLIREGFDFNYHTHYVRTKIHGNEFIFCLDYGYREVETGKIQIIKSF